MNLKYISICDFILKNQKKNKFIGKLLLHYISDQNI